jgi:hypothetical protein
MSELADELEALLLRTAFEAHDALARGLPLADAARDGVRFPSLFRLHAGLGDALELSIATEVGEWLDDARRSAEQLDRLREGLVQVAALGQPLEAALARFLLFEAVRTRLLVAAWASDTAFEAAGGDPEDVDAIAAAEVARAVASSPSLPPDIRRFRLLLAAAMVELTRHAEELRASLARAQGDLVASFGERAAIEAQLRELDPVDAVLVRNELARYLGEERVTIEELTRRHPVLLGGHKRDALDQRMSRFRRRLLSGGLRAIRTRVGDSIAEALSED